MIDLGASTRHTVWRTALRLNGGIDVEGSLPAGGCVVVAQHCSHADAPSLLAALDAAHRPVVAAAADYWFDNRVKAWVCRRLVGGFPVRRTGGGYADLAAQRSSVEAGAAVVVFPAGSRHSPDGRFHVGAFRFAQLCGVPVVPVRLTGTADVLSAAGVPHRARIRVVIGEPIMVSDPEAAARDVQGSLASGGDEVAPDPSLRVWVARLAASRARLALAFTWAVAEGISWPILSELLIAALVLSGPDRALRSGVRLAIAATLGSAVGGTITLLLARHGVLLPQPLTAPPMAQYAHDQLAAHGPTGLWSQPASGIPYKVYARAAGLADMSLHAWFVSSLEVRAVRMLAVAALAAVVQRLTVRWQRLYTRAMAAGLVTFVLALCLVVSAWSDSPTPH